MHTVCIWHILTHFWIRHDILFTHFGIFAHWVTWNLHHFRHVPHIRQWHGWAALWEWCNIHG